MLRAAEACLGRRRSLDLAPRFVAWGALKPPAWPSSDRLYGRAARQGGDATNYVTERDGAIAAIETGQNTSTEVIAAHLSGAGVVKTYSSIFWKHLRDGGRPHGSLNRRALPLACVNPDAKEAATQLLTDIVFDAVAAAHYLKADASIAVRLHTSVGTPPTSSPAL